MADNSLRLYTAGQVRRLDACAIDERGIAGYELMCRAGAAVVAAARARFPDARRWLVLCGGGNNGGDGYVIARLALELGIEVDLCALKAPEDLGGDAATAARDWQQAGGAIRTWPPGRNAHELVFDALLGTGLDRSVGGPYREAVEWVNRLAAPVVAVDIPSGLNADTGRSMGVTVRADLTVSFIGLKRGMFTGDGADYCGEVVYDDLETPPDIHASVPEAGTLIRENIIGQLLPARRRNSHKGDFGHVLVVGGGPGMSGAARLAGEAALRSGAGLVSIATHPVHAHVLNLSRPELMVSSVAGPADLSPLLERASVLAVGPGIGVSRWARDLFNAGLEAALPVVLDADGLNLLAERQAWKRDRWVLTPHPGEAGRLLRCGAAEIQQDRVTAAQRLADRFNAVCVLKGCGSVVADPGGAYAICPLGNPGMATGGSGDVLTGVIGALLAQGLAPWQAALAGVAAHAAAGDRVAARYGERGMLAADIAGQLPAVLNPPGRA